MAGGNVRALAVQAKPSNSALLTDAFASPLRARLGAANRNR